MVKYTINRQELKILIILVSLILGGMLGIDIHVASLPYIMKYMHTDKQHMQLSVSIYLLGLGVSLLVYGPLSDEYGRKPVVIVGLCIAIVASFTAAFAKNVLPFLALRFLQGIGAGVGLGLGKIIAADLMQGDKLIIVGSYFSIFLCLSPLFAPVLGSYIQHLFAWQANFIVVGGYLLVVFFIYLVFCPETNHHKQPNAFSIHKLWVNYSELLKNPFFIGCMLLAGSSISISMIYATISSFIFQIQFHLSAIDYGWITMLVSIGSVLGRLFNPFFIKNIGSHKTLFFAGYLLLFANIGMLLLDYVGLITIPLMLIIIFLALTSQAFISAISMAYSLGPFHHNRGSAGAIYSSFQMLVAFLSSALVSSFSYQVRPTSSATYQ